MYAVYVRSWNKSIYRRCSYETAYQRIVLTCIRVKDKGARANTAYTWYTRSPGGKSYDEITRVYPGSHRAKEKAFSSTSISSNKYLPPLETILFEKFRSFEFPFNSVRKFSPEKGSELYGSELADLESVFAAMRGNFYNESTVQSCNRRDKSN